MVVKMQLRLMLMLIPLLSCCVCTYCDLWWEYELCELCDFTRSRYVPRWKAIGMTWRTYYIMPSGVTFRCVSAGCLLLFVIALPCFHAGVMLLMSARRVALVTRMSSSRCDNPSGSNHNNQTNLFGSESR